MKFNKLSLSLVIYLTAFSNINADFKDRLDTVWSDIISWKMI